MESRQTKEVLVGSAPQMCSQTHLSIPPCPSCSWFGIGAATRPDQCETNCQLSLKHPPLITKWRLQSLLCVCKHPRCKGPTVPPFWLLSPGQTSPNPRRGDASQRGAKARLVWLLHPQFL